MSSSCHIGWILHHLKTRREGFVGPGKTGEKWEEKILAMPSGGSEDDCRSRESCREIPGLVCSRRRMLHGGERKP